MLIDCVKQAQASVPYQSYLHWLYFIFPMHTLAFKTMHSSSFSALCPFSHTGFIVPSRLLWGREFRSYTVIIQASLYLFWKPLLCLFPPCPELCETRRLIWATPKVQSLFLRKVNNLFFLSHRSFQCVLHCGTRVIIIRSIKCQMLNDELMLRSMNNCFLHLYQHTLIEEFT